MNRNISLIIISIGLIVFILLLRNNSSGNIGDSQIIFESDRGAEHGLYKVDKNGIAFLIDGGCPHIAKNGNKVVFINYKFDSQLREYKMQLAIYDRKLNKESYLNTDGLVLSIYPSPKFSPDSKYVAFIASKQGGKGNNVYLVSTDSNEIQQITNYADNSKSFIQSLDWFPAGDCIAYKNRGEGLVRLDINSKKQDLLIDAKQFSLGEFSIAEDAKRIVFSGNGKIENKLVQYPQSELFLFDIATKDIDRLTNNKYDERYPSFDSAGEKICYTSFRQHSPLAGGELYIMDISSRKEHKITKAKRKGVISPFGGLTNDIYPSWKE